jgi:hypothetical protein
MCKPFESASGELPSTLNMGNDLPPTRFRVERDGLAFCNFVNALRANEFQLEWGQAILVMRNNGSNGTAAVFAFHAKW